jgi:hypothetical protein
MRSGGIHCIEAQTSKALSLLVGFGTLGFIRWWLYLFVADKEFVKEVTPKIAQSEGGLVSRWVLYECGK